MQPARNMSIRCPACGQPFNAALESIVDAESNPQAKIRLLSGQLNNVRCPNCNTVSTIAAPILYHDGSKDLLIAHVPMELNMQQDAQERAIGDLLRTLMNNLPQDARKGYLLQPRRALTLQNLIEQVLAADGVTPAMMAEQRARVDLIQQLATAADIELPALIQANDAQLNAAFFQTMTLIAQQMAQQGQTAVAQQVMARQAEILEQCSYGKTLLEQQEAQNEMLEQVEADLEALPEEPSRDDFMQLAIRYAESDEKLQALVGLVRPVFDYEFFQELTLQIGKAPAGEREKLEALRDKVLDYTSAIDQQAQMALQQTVAVLREIINSPDPDAAIQDNLPLIDDTFMTVLEANMQEAERRNDVGAAARLKDIYQRVIVALRESMQPELRFINELLGMDSDEDIVNTINARAASFGPDLLPMMDAVEQVLASRGDTTLLSKFAFLRVAVERALD